MSGTLIRNARVLTLAGPAGPRRGEAMRRLGIIPRADVLLRDGVIARIDAGDSPSLLRREGDPAPAEVVDAAGRVLMPAFVDCHTHACWAGSRLEEWERTLAGVPYLDILREGGGIMSTVRAVRAASRQDLADALRARLAGFASLGTLTVEVKSGYGLTTHDELKMLRAIGDAAAAWPGTVVPTALLGHAIDGAQPDFVDRTVRETLPAVHAEFPGIAIDAYLERGAWSLADVRRLFDRARELGHPVRLHADQFNALGGVGLGVELGARSIDHLEASTDEDLRRLADSPTVGVGLPICGVHLDGRFARLGEVVRRGGAVALATNCNPGSAPSRSMPTAIALGVRKCGLSAPEAVTACTVNAAAVLGLDDRAVIEIGRRADVILLNSPDERDLAYELGGNPVGAAWCAGRRVV